MMASAALAKKPAIVEETRDLYAPFLRAKENFLDGLDDDSQLNLFDGATVENFYQNVADISRDDRKSKARVVGRKLQPLITAITDLGEAMDALTNTAPMFLGPIWGSLRVVLVVAGKYKKFYERIVDTLGRIGDILPRFKDYQRIFDPVKHARLTLAISKAYTEIMNLCTDFKALLQKQQGSAFQRMWKPLSFNQNKHFEEAVQRFRILKSNVEKEAETAHMIEAADARAMVQRNNVIAETKRKAELRGQLLASLTKLNPEQRHQRLKKQCHPNTGTWLLISPEYKDWTASEHSSMFCLYGIPGCGKSVLASQVISDMTISKKVTLAYHYCDYADKRTLDPINIFSGLIRGLLEKIEIPTQIEQDILEFYKNDEEPPEVDQVLGILLATLEQFSDAVVFAIDGLDEVAEKDRIVVYSSLKTILNHLGQSENGIVLRLFITSREDVTTNVAVPGTFTFRQQASPSTISMDIGSFVRHSVRHLLESGSLVISNPSLEEEIITALLEGAKGMFLWVKFQLDDLCSAETDLAIKAVLQELPQSLSETYDRLLSRITGSSRRDLVRRMFQWIVCTKRPLFISELREGIAFTLEDQQWDVQKIPTDMPRLIRACGNLVVIDEETKTVEFAHHTIQQYLLQESDDEDHSFHFTMEEANNTVGELCLAYLCFSNFESQVTMYSDTTTPNMKALERAVTTQSLIGRDNLGYKAVKLYRNFGDHPSTPEPSNINYSRHIYKGRRPPQNLMQRFSLLEYIVENWLAHTSGFCANLSGILTRVEKDGFTKVLRETKLALLSGNCGDPRRFSLLHDLALKKQLLFDIRPWKVGPFATKEWANMIGWALGNNHLPLICMLLTKDQSLEPWVLTEEAGQRIFKNEEATCITTAIQDSIWHLAQESDARKVDALKWFYSKLLVAARHGNLDILRLCIPLSPQEFPSTHIRGHLLLEAAIGGQKELVAYLLEGGAQHVAITSVHEQHAYNAMELAAIYGHLDIVKFLRGSRRMVARGLRDGEALRNAAEEGNLTVVASILEALKLTSDAEFSDSFQKILSKAMDAAASNGDLAVLQLFLKEGVDSTRPGADGQSVMINAIRRKQYDVVQAILLEGYGARECYGSSEEAAPMLWAAAIGHLGMAQLLIDHGAELYPSEDCLWHSPLFVAAANGHIAMVKLLMEEHAPADGGIAYLKRVFKESGKETSEFESQKTLSDLGVLPPVYAAAVNGHHEIASILRRSKTFQDLDGSLEKADFLEEALWNHVPLLRLIIATSTDLDRPNFKGETILTIACAQGRTAAVKALIAAGANVNPPNLLPKSPLLNAVMIGNVEIVRMLLDARAVPKQDCVLAAMDGKRYEILRLLFRHGANTESRIARGSEQVILGNKTPRGATPLIIAAAGGDLKIVQILINENADVNKMDDEKKKPALLHAMENGHEQVARALENLTMMNQMKYLFGMNFNAAGGEKKDKSKDKEKGRRGSEQIKEKEKEKGRRGSEQIKEKENREKERRGSEKGKNNI